MLMLHYAQSKALEMWRALEAESGTSLLRRNGLLFYGETDTGGWHCAAD